MNQRELNELIEEYYTHINKWTLKKYGYKKFKRKLSEIEKLTDFTKIKHLKISEEQLRRLTIDEYCKLTKTNPSFFENIPMSFTYGNVRPSVTYPYTAYVTTDDGHTKKIKKISGFEINNKYNYLTFPRTFHEFTHAKILTLPNFKKGNGEYLKAETLMIFYELVGADIFSKLDPNNENLKDIENIEEVLKNYKNGYQVLQQRMMRKIIDREKKIKEQIKETDIFNSYRRNNIKAELYNSERFLVSYGLASLLFERYQQNPEKVLEETNKCLTGEKTINQVLRKFHVSYNNTQIAKNVKKVDNLTKK